MKQLFDPIRKIHVPDLPEERVRQFFILHMIEDLKYPKALLRVEVDLRSIPSLTAKEGLPLRRADIICFTSCKTKSLTALLLVECKAESLSKKVEEQAIGYNYFIQAPFIALVNEKEIKTLFFDEKKKLTSLNFLPSYKELQKSFSLC